MCAHCDPFLTKFDCSVKVKFMIQREVEEYVCSSFHGFQAPTFSGTQGNIELKYQGLGTSPSQQLKIENIFLVLIVTCSYNVFKVMG